MSEDLAKEAFTYTDDCYVKFSLVNSDLTLLSGGLENVLSIDADGYVSVDERLFAFNIFEANCCS